MRAVGAGPRRIRLLSRGGQSATLSHQTDKAFHLVEQDLALPPAADIRLLARVAAILRIVAAERQSRRLSDIAEATGLSKATTHRLLAGLCAEELLEKSGEDGSYRLGPLACRIGAAASGPQALRARARPVLARIAQATGETALMFQLAPTGAAAICIEQIESAHGLRLVAEIGSRMPLHAGGGPRAILAHLPKEEVSAVLAPLPAAAARRVRGLISETLASGYAISFQETNDGVSGIGVPFFDARRRVLGSVALVGPLSRVDNARLLELAPLLMEAAAEITAMQEGIAR
jgi:IclR family acetate operon transcriptional repressor